MLTKNCLPRQIGDKAPRVGAELPQESLGISPQAGEALQKAVQKDPVLARLVALWPTLPEATRRKIAVLVEAGCGDASGNE